VAPVAPQFVPPISCLEAPAERPIPTGEPAPAPGTDQLQVQVWARRQAERWARDLMLYSDELRDKQVTCKVALEAQLPKG
jgi:hypothetical protein